MLADKKRPTLGIRPRLFWIEDRMQEVRSAIARYHEDKNQVPEDVITESLELNEMWDTEHAAWMERIRKGGGR